MLVLGSIKLVYLNISNNFVYLLILDEKAIDGSSIFLLEENDLIEEVKVESNIVRKKILNWTQKILVEYGIYLMKNKTYF